MRDTERVPLDEIEEIKALKRELHDLRATTLKRIHDISFAWIDFTALWEAVTTDPVINNGDITGRYKRIGDLIIFQGKIIMGSTTTFGSGEYSVALPLTRDNIVSNVVIGNAWLRNVSPGADYHPFCFSVSTDKFRLRGFVDGASQNWTSTTPFTLAVGDWLSWNIAYETDAAL